MMLQNKNIVKVKPGLYLLIAKSKGYRIIEYSPSQDKSCVFSINCRLDCKIRPFEMDLSICQTCGEELDLYRDPIMAQFLRPVRIDLLTKRYSNLPTSVNSWLDLPQFKHEELSHIKYYKAFSKIQEPQLKECLNNFYHYHVMPIAKPRSFWHDYGFSINQCYCVYTAKVNNGEQQQLLVRVGGEVEFMIQLEAQLIPGIKDCAYFNNYLVLFCKQKTISLIFYELPSSPTQMVHPKHRLELGDNLEENPLDFSISFQDQKLNIIVTDKKAKAIGLYQIQNIMSEVLKIQNVLQTNYDGENPTFSLELTEGTDGQADERNISLVLINQSKIELKANRKSIQIQNGHKITNIAGSIQNETGQKIYFYQICEKETQIITFNQTAEKLTTLTVPLQNFAFEQLIDKMTHQTIILQKPMADGCLFYQYFQLENKIRMAKCCLI